MVPLMVLVMVLMSVLVLFAVVVVVAVVWSFRSIRLSSKPLNPLLEALLPNPVRRYLFVPGAGHESGPIFLRAFARPHMLQELRPRPRLRRHAFNFLEMAALTPNPFLSQPILGDGGELDRGHLVMGVARQIHPVGVYLGSRWRLAWAAAQRDGKLSRRLSADDPERSIFCLGRGPEVARRHAECGQFFQLQSRELEC